MRIRKKLRLSRETLLRTEALANVAGRSEYSVCYSDFIPQGCGGSYYWECPDPGPSVAC